MKGKTMSYRSWFRTKTVELILRDSESTEGKLKRSLGPFQLTMLGIGAIIGAGIYTTIGTAVAGDALRPGAGPAIILSFFLTGIVCVFTAVCYAEFASIVPISGSAYTYSYASLGEIIAWIIGWDLIIEYSVSSIAVAVSWSNYFRTFLKGFGIFIPDWLAMDYRTAAQIVDAAGVQVVFRDAPHLIGVPIVLNLVAVGIITLIILVLVWGIRESSNFNILMVTFKIAVLTFFIFIGFKWVRPENWQPFAPNGWAGLSTGAAIVFFAFIGFDAVSTAAEETRNPKRDLPIGILASLAICTVFYVLVAAVFTGLIPYQALKSTLLNEQAEPLTLALRYGIPNPGFAEGLVAIGAVVAQAAVLLVMLFGQPRILFSMSRDGLLPSAFSRVHPRFKTPAFSTITTGLVVAGIAAVANIEEMVDLTNVGTLFAFILVCSGIIVLRIKEPDRPRPFRVPGGWLWSFLLYSGFFLVVLFLPLTVLWKVILLSGGAIFFALLRNHVFPALGIVSCLYLIYYLPPTSWLRFGAWLNFGFVIYAGYGSFNSRLTGTAASRETVSHSVQAYFNGVWLLLAGTSLLFLLRGIDIFQAAYHANKGLAGFEKAGAAFALLLTPGPWLKVSWFLIVPLVLNSFVLCPVIIRKSMKTWRMEDQLGRYSRTSFAMSAALVLFSAFYLCGVTAYNLF
jgi:basic amino acid/polyamine antiporter, APA family